ESPQRLGACAVVDEAVQRREDRGARGHRRVIRVGVRDELPALEPHAERAEALLLADLQRLLQGELLRLGEPALGKIPDALLAAATDDRHLAAGAHALEHQAHLARAPPAVVLALRPRMV